MAENEWELSKENVLPLKQGRSISNLTAGLQPSADQAARIKQERAEFESELRTYDGDDPLDVWFRYIRWTEQTFPKGGKESRIQDLLQRCVAEYKDVEKYKNDTRYLTLWLKFANICKDSSEIFSFLFSQKIGYKLASFYEAWASEIERSGNTKRADTIYKQGLENGAEPLELLKSKHGEFQARVSRRYAGEMVAPPEPVTMAEEPKRIALGSLKARGTKAKVGVDRTVSTVGGGLRQSQSIRPNAGPTGFTVANDENADPQTMPQPTGEWGAMPSAADHKENTQNPGVWNKTKMKQRHQPVVKLNEISSVVKPEFSVHTDSEDQPMVTPRKIHPQMDNVLSAKKPEKNSDPFYQIQHQQPVDPNQRPMYCKDKVYAGALEFQFEEIRAVRWKEKQKLLEAKKLKEDIEREREELRKQQEEFLAQKHQMNELLASQRRQQEEALQLHKEMLLQEQVKMKQEMQKQMEQERLRLQEQMSSLNIKKQDLNKSIAKKKKVPTATLR